MKKLALCLLILAPAGISAMYFNGDQRGRIPTAEELMDGYIPTQADFVAGYVPDLDDIEDGSEFEEIKNEGTDRIFEAKQENGESDVAVTQLVFHKDGVFKEPRFLQRREGQKVFPKDFMPTKQDKSYKPDYYEINGNENFEPVAIATPGFCFKSRVPNADGAYVVIWNDEEGNYDKIRFRTDRNDHEFDRPATGSKKKRSSVGFLTYLGRNKFKLAALCGVGILVAAITKYLYSSEKVSS